MFDTFARFVAKAAGRPTTFSVAVAIVVLWAVTGPFFDWNERWQLIINTTTTIVTFLMVFVLQHSTNRNERALQAKLDELIRVTENAHDDLIGVEEAEEHDFERKTEEPRR